jgi:membrane fusion protein (multidrug efflux system)
MKYLTKVIAAAFFALNIYGCGNQEETSRKLDQAAKPPVAVETITAASSELIDGIEVTGSLEPKFSADVKTQIPGLVKQVLVTEWVRVEKGQPLARIDVAETDAAVKRAEAALESARAGLAQAEVAGSRTERELNRILKLKESGLATQQAVDDARSEMEAAKSRVEAARAQINVAKGDLRQGSARQTKGQVNSPIDGIVAMRDINVGDLASDAAAAKPVFRIVDNRLLNLTVTVPSADSSRVKVGQPIEFSVDSLPGRLFTGKVMYINPELSMSDRSLKVIAEVSNRDEQLKGGMFAKGRIVAGRRSNVLLVLRSAIAALDLSGRKGSLFIIDKGAARRRDIRTGSISGDMVEVTEGLASGEQYVIRGGFNLKDGDRVAVAARAL